MYKYIKSILLALLISFAPVYNADTYVGVGAITYIPGKDIRTTEERWGMFPSLYWKENDSPSKPIFVTLNYRKGYEVYKSEIPEHYIIAAGVEAYNYVLNENVKFYLDLGVAATSDINIATSSRWMFYEGIGVEIFSYRVGLNHTSNAGIVPPNEGETAFTIDYKIEF